MLSKKISLFVASVMVTNFIGTAAYAKKTSEVDESLIDQSIVAQNLELKRNLEQVTALIKSIEKYRTASKDEKQNAFVNAARLLITVLGVSSAAVHVKNAKAQSSVELTLTAVMGVLSTVLEAYVASQKIDMEEVKELLAKHQQELVGSISSATDQKDAVMIAAAVAQLGQISESMNSQMNDIKRAIDAGQVDVAIIAFSTLVLNIAAPFLPGKIKDAVVNKAPTLIGHAAKTKKHSMQGLGATNLATVFSTFAGMMGKDSQQQLDSILANLRVTQANMAAALK